MLPTLFSFRRCPYAIRARMAILRAGISVDLREVSLRDKPPAMLSLSPKGTVPVLQCADSRVLDESLDIMRWALRQADPDHWLRHDDRADLQHLLLRNDGPFKQALDHYKYAQRHPDFSRIVYRERAENALIADLEKLLERRDFVAGEHAGLIDVAIFPFVRQFAAVEADWFDGSPWQHTRRWLHHWLSSPWFTTALAKGSVQGPAGMSPRR